MEETGAAESLHPPASPGFLVWCGMVWSGVAACLALRAGAKGKKGAEGRKALKLNSAGICIA